MKSNFKIVVFAVLLSLVVNSRMKTRNTPIPTPAPTNPGGPAPKLKLEVGIIKKSTSPSNKGIDLVSLADHEVDCDHGTLSQYRLEKVGADKYKINYQCMQPDSKKCNSECAKKIQEYDKVKCKTFETKQQPIDPKELKNNEAMGSLDVQCPPKFSLKSFRAKFTKETTPKMYYEFVCCPAKTNACGKKFTSELAYTKNEKNLSALDRFDIGVSDLKTQALTGFRFVIVPSGKNPDTDWKSKYEIRYCTLFG